MRVKRNFEVIYKSQPDPWNIGNADSERYNLYYDLIMAKAHSKGSILDIGCGFGAFLSRFRNDFQQLIGIELSQAAIAKGREKYPKIEFRQGSAARLDQVEVSEVYDTIIYSDVIYYLPEAGKNASLGWISKHLSPEGLALIAAWSPGGKYITYEELRGLITKYLVIEEEMLLDSGHAVFVARRKRTLIAITIDYETWHPIPEGKRIDWEQDVFIPTEKYFQVAAETGIKLTFMAELGEYFWLCRFRPEIADKMAEQWREALRRGHDIQLHLHPNWLPELGASFRDGAWSWDWTYARLSDFPGDLPGLIAKCKETLEELLGSETPGYRVTSFRAGAYATQPFKRLSEALIKSGIFCDTSVYAGGYSKERGYDYSLAYSRHQPYFANHYDPQLKAPPSELQLVELPVFTFLPNQRWFCDGTEGSVCAERMLTYLKQWRRKPSIESYRRIKWIKQALGIGYYYLKPFHGLLRRILPKTVTHFLTAYGPEKLAGHEYFVMIGHTKGEHDFEAIARNLAELKQQRNFSGGCFEFITLSEMAGLGREELSQGIRRDEQVEMAYQVQREYRSVMGEERNLAQSAYLQERIPLDRSLLLDLGCGSGYWSERLARMYPWMTVTGVDCSPDFIAKAWTRVSDLTPGLTFQEENFARMSLADGLFDCVYAANVLEHAFDVDQTLREVYRVLRQGGVLMAAIPSDARNPNRICDNHTWKTAPPEIEMRLSKAGFVNIELWEVDVFRELGGPPFPPSRDQMTYLRAWKRPKEISSLERALELMDWTYRRLQPDRPSLKLELAEILKEGFAYCIGYVIVLGELLRREGYPVKWVTMMARDHAKGRGQEGLDSHEVIEVNIDGKLVILDPMANTYLPYSLPEILEHPELAGPKADPDSRYLERDYWQYDTDYWYRRVYRYCYRGHYDQWEGLNRWRRNRWLKVTGLSTSTKQLG